MSTTLMAIFSNPLFATYSVYARNASTVQSVSLYYFNYILYSQIIYNNNNNNLYIYKAHIVNLVQTDLNKK